MYVCPDTGCGWTPPFEVDDDDDWADMLEVHRIVKLEGMMRDDAPAE